MVTGSEMGKTRASEIDAPVKSREPPPILKKLLDYDRILTHKLFGILRRIFQISVLKPYLISLEYSCHGILWLVFWFLCLLSFGSNSESIHLQFNMIYGLIIDIIIVGVSKAYFRRQRPITTANSGYAFNRSLDPKQLSLPSGHVSRATYVTYFFCTAFPTSIFVQSIILVWSIMVLFSRLLLERNYILDLVVGISTGLLTGKFIEWFTLSESSTNYFYSLLNSYNNANST